MTGARRFALVLLLWAAGGLACNRKANLLERRDGGAAGISGHPGGGGSGGFGGSFDSDAGTDAATDLTTDVTPDVSTEPPPDPLPGYRWVALPAPLGASIRAIAFDGDGVMYAGAGGGDLQWLPSQAGIFKSTDDGASWRAASVDLFTWEIGPVTDYKVTTLAAVGTTIYAGAENLLRSTDGGASWQQVAVGSTFSAFNHIAGAGSVVVAASDFDGFNLWVSTDAGNTFQQTPVTSGWTFDVQVLAMGSVVMVTGQGGVVRSTDRGATFTPLQGKDSAFPFAGAPRCDGQRTCYATSTETANSGDNLLLKSTDAGATWTPLPTTFAAGVVVHAVSDTGVLFVQVGGMIERSVDGGATFEILGFPPTMTGAFEPYCPGPYVYPPYVAHGAKLFAACGGVYQLDDTAHGWTPASGSPASGPITGGAARMFVDTSPTALGPSGDIYVVGIEGLNPRGEDQYLLKRSSDGGWTWQILASPFTTYGCIVTPGGSLLCETVAMSPNRNMALARSDDHGATWREVQLPVGPSGYPIGLEVATDGSFVYLYGGGFARSTDDGRTFQVVPDARQPQALQVLRNGHLLGVESFNGGFRSTDQGTTWEPVPALVSLPVIEDAAGRLIRYAGYGKLEASTDEAATWTPLASSGFPDTVDVYLQMAVDGLGHLFVLGAGPPRGSLSYGPVELFASADGGGHFWPMRAQIPNPHTTSFATDKQGRLLVATAGGVFRLESDADPGPARPDGGTSGPPDAGGGGPAPRPLSWVTGQDGLVPGPSAIAVDAAERLYTIGRDYYTINVMDGGTISPYLTLAEAASTAGLASAAQLFDIDVGPDGQLYVLISSASPWETTGTDLVVTSNAAHRATLLRDLGELTNGRMEVIAAGRVGYFARTGFSTATAAGTQRLYTAAALGWSDACQVVRRDLAIADSGAVAFLPGCTDRAVQRGTVDGDSLGVLYQPNADATYREHVSCIAKDRAGGFYAVVTDVVSRHNPRLVHLPETVTGTTAPTLIPTLPTLGEASFSKGGGLFDDCTMTVAPNGVIYLYSGNHIWKVGL